MKCPPARPQPPRRGDPLAGNVPVQLTRLVGRDSALAELRSLVWRTRVLTLAGPGGAGKTRLGHRARRRDAAGLRRRGLVGRSVDDARVGAGRPGRRRERARRRGERRPEPGDARPPAPRVDAAGAGQLRAGRRRMRRADRRAARALPVAAGDRDQPSASRRPGRAGVARRRPGDRRHGRARRAPARRPGRRRGRAVHASGPARRRPRSIPTRRGSGRTCGASASGSTGCRWPIELAAARVPVLSVTQIAQRLEVDPSLLRHTGADGARAPPHARWNARVEPPDARARRAAPVPPAQRRSGVRSPWRRRRASAPATSSISARCSTCSRC